MLFSSLVRLFFASSSRNVAGTSVPDADGSYEPPLLAIPGGVRRVTLGSSPSGNADANSQYYW